jgi:hypothetical protein
MRNNNEDGSERDKVVIDEMLEKPMCGIEDKEQKIKTHSKK